MAKKNNIEKRNLNMIEMIHQIIYLIKNKNDYSSAAEIILNNEISMNNLYENTFKLSQVEIAKLTDYIIERRR